MVITVAATLALVRIQNQTEYKYKHKLQLLQDVHTKQIIELKKSKQQSDKEIQDLKNQLQTKRSKAASDALLAAASVIAPKAQASSQTAPTQPTGDIAGTITKWAGHYGVDSAWLLRVARCESTFNPSAVNHGYYAGGGNPTGLFQFLPQTFAANAVRAGIPGANIWDVDSQAHVAAYMFSIGQSGQWACK